MFPLWVERGWGEGGGREGERAPIFFICDWSGTVGWVKKLIPLLSSSSLSSSSSCRPLIALTDPFLCFKKDQKEKNNKQQKEEKPNSPPPLPFSRPLNISFEVNTSFLSPLSPSLPPLPPPHSSPPFPGTMFSLPLCPSLSLSLPPLPFSGVFCRGIGGC